MSDYLKLEVDHPLSISLLLNIRFEDGESDGVRIPENAGRKTLRHRALSTEATPERRKSRRHSTGTTPPPPPLPKSIPPPPPPSSQTHLTMQSMYNNNNNSNHNNNKMSHLPQQSVICEMDAGEDSSSSQNSTTEVNRSVFRECRDSGNDSFRLGHQHGSVIWMMLILTSSAILFSSE